MSKNLKAAQYDVVQRMRSGEGITAEDLQVLSGYARASGSSEALVQYSKGKRLVQDDKSNDKQNEQSKPQGSDVIAVKTTQLDAAAQKAKRTGRAEDRVAYVKAKRALSDAKVDEHNRAVLTRVIEEARANGTPDHVIAAFLNDDIDE